MPRFRIIHETIYDYSDNVFFEPHYLRLKPKNTPHSTLEHFGLIVLPTPDGIAEQFDIEDNLIHYCWFQGVHQYYKIRSESIVEIVEFNPFNFIIYPERFLKIPFDYDESHNKLLRPALEVQDLPKQLIEYGEAIKKESDYNTTNFITALTQQIHKDFTIDYREQGSPHEPGLTYSQKSGSCRDVSWMQIQLLRYSGIASRFVSGYFFVESDKPEFELHAWIEAFIPGAGWIGFDPSHGIAAGSSHIAVANSAYVENTMPVTGSVRGDASSVLKNNLFIEKLS